MMIIGFFYGTRGKFSEMMSVPMDGTSATTMPQLVPVAPVLNKPKLPVAPLITPSPTLDKAYSKTQLLQAINDKWLCYEGTNCEGWSMEVESHVATDIAGRSEWVIRAMIEAPSDFSKAAIFGAGFALDTGVN